MATTVVELYRDLFQGAITCKTRCQDDGLTVAPEELSLAVDIDTREEVCAGSQALSLYHPMGIATAGPTRGLQMTVDRMMWKEAPCPLPIKDCRMVEVL